jgi:hypothetical protein
VALTADGVDGDLVVDRRNHGGTDKAAYAYARDADWWQRHLGRWLTNAAFGESLTLDGVDLMGAVIWKRWALGGAVLEIRRFLGGVPDPHPAVHAFQGARQRGAQAWAGRGCAGVSRIPRR